MNKKKNYILALLALGLSAYTADAQNIIMNIDGTTNKSLDYIATQNKYVLLGESHSTSSINGMSNISAFGWYLGRITLQIVNTAPATEMIKTYCTKQEVDLVKWNACKSLGVHFNPFDAKQTQDGGFIICGSVLKNFETFSCTEANGNSYSDIFLLKTDEHGEVQWYNRYDNGDWLYSVIEDPQTGNFIACGEKGISAFILCVDNQGTPLWAKETHTPFSDDPDNLNSSRYTEITPYKSGDQQYYALTGTSGKYYQISGYKNKGGILLSLVDQNGTFLNNVVITGDAYDKFHQGSGIHSAGDGDVVLSGGIDGTVCGDKNGNNVLLAKINPLSLSMNFIQTYNNEDAGFASSVTVRQERDEIYVAGTDLINGTNRKMFMKTNYSGNFSQYVSYNNAYAPVAGSAIVYNTNDEYVAYSGISSGMGSGEGSSIIQDNWGYNCDPFQELSQENVDYDIMGVYSLEVPVNSIPEPILAFDLPLEEEYTCGGGLGPAQAKAQQELVAAPNPATDKLILTLPSGWGKTANIQVYDVAGKYIKTPIISSDAEGSIILDVSSLQSGIYLISVHENGKETKHSRFSKR